MIWLDRTFIILVPYNTINWVHSDTGTTDQRARKKVHQVIRATFALASGGFLMNQNVSITKYTKLKRLQENQTDRVQCTDWYQSATTTVTRPISWFIWFLLLGMIIILRQIRLRNNILFCLMFRVVTDCNLVLSVGTNPGKVVRRS